MLVCCSSNCFAERLVAFAAVEGIFFSGRYAQVVYTVSASLQAKMSPLLVNGLAHSLCPCFHDLH